MDNLLLGNLAETPSTKLYFCKVTRFYASSNTVDVVTIDDDVSLLGCQIACSLPAGITFGQRYIPSHDDTSSETGHIMSPGDIYCIAAYINGDYYNSAIIGFLFPKETALSIPDYGLYLFRHESDVMWMIRGDGTVQMYHPSGSIFKIGVNDINEMSEDIMIPAKTDGLYIQDAAKYNEKYLSNLFITWHAGQKVTLNSDGEIILQTRDASSTITMQPDGTVSINTTKAINATTKDVVVEASGDVNITASENVNVTAVQLNLNLDSAPGSLTINGLEGKTGYHEHSGNVQFRSTLGIITQYGGP